MRALLWKEFREKRLWIIPLTLSTAGMVLLGYGYTFCGSIYTYTPQIVISSLVALLMGLGTYSRELSGDTVDFLYSRPVSWKRILLAKLMVGIGIILAAAVIAAVVYRITVPEPYVRFTSLTALLRGIGVAMVVMVVPYLVASLTSVVLPGMIGGMLILIVIFTVVGVEMWLVNATYVRPSYPSLYASSTTMPFVVILSWPVALITAGLLIVRFGLTLSTGARALRYTLVALAIAAVLTPLDFVLGHKVNDWLCRMQVQAFSVSPTGKYALAMMSNDIRYGGPAALVRLSDGEQVILGYDGFLGGYWYGDKRYAIVDNRIVSRIPSYQLQIVWMNPQGYEVRKIVDPGKARWMYLQPSPSGRYAVIIAHVKEKSTIRELRFVDIAKARMMDISPIETRFSRFFWLSDSVFVYYDNKGVRHSVSVGER